jgi:hypothetical protein
MTYFRYNSICFTLKKRNELILQMGPYTTDTDGNRPVDVRPRTGSGKMFEWTQLLCFICLWTSSASVRFGNIIHNISAPERDRLQKNETNHTVRPRLLLSESIVRPACIGWGNGVERRGVSLTARRLWMSGSGRPTRHNMAMRRRPQQVVCALARCFCILCAMSEEMW